MRRFRAAAIVALAAPGCGDDASTTSGADTNGSTGTSSGAAMTETTSEEGPLCESDDSRFTVRLASPELAAFVLHIGNGSPSTTATCPDGTLDGNFASGVECAAGTVTLFKPSEFSSIGVQVAIDDGAPQSFDVTCENTSMCPKQGRNSCEIDLGDTGASSST